MMKIESEVPVPGAYDRHHIDSVRRHPIPRDARGCAAGILTAVCRNPD